MDLNTFKEQVLPHRDKMYRFALGFIRNEEEARDIVQEVFLKMWEDRHSLEKVVNIAAWSMTMVRNKALDKLKSGQTRFVIEKSAESFGCSQSTVEDPQQLLSQKESILLIEKTLQLMPETQRTVFKLREFRQYSYAEIAEVLKIEVNYVKILLHRARKALREKLIALGEHGY